MSKAGKPGRKFGQDLIDVQLRRADVLRLHAAGITMTAIAQKYGVSVQTISDDVKKALAAIPREPAEYYRNMQLENLAEARGALSVKVRQGDTRAISTLIRVWEHESKLRGIMAPTELSVSGGADFAAAAASMLRDIAELDKALAERREQMADTPVSPQESHVTDDDQAK